MSNSGQITPQRTLKEKLKQAQRQRQKALKLERQKRQALQKQRQQQMKEQKKQINIQARELRKARKRPFRIGTLEILLLVFILLALPIVLFLLSF